MADSQLTVDDVTIARGPVDILSHVSFDVRTGCITSLVGPNGAGKTTMLEAISGLLPLREGRIQEDGTDLAKLGPRKRFQRGIVHVEQGRTVFPSLTVRENIRVITHDPQALTDAVELFPELEKRMDSSAGLLSGGEQQMVALARAVAAKPRFLLIDEMSLGLAPVVFMRLLPNFRRFADAGMGVLLVEQFAHLALEIADEAVVISGGTMTYRGSPRQLIDHPETLHAAYLGGDDVETGLAPAH